MDRLPGGTVTLLFADIEGSTWLVQELGDEYVRVLDGVRAVLRAAVADAGGQEVDCRADELFAAFTTATAGVVAAVAAQRGLAATAWPGGAAVRVRMGLHTGEPILREGGYVGVPVNAAARVCAAAHGGQILLSDATRDVLGERVEVKDLGEHALSGFSGRRRLFQIVAPGLEGRFGPPRSAPPARERSRFVQRRRGKKLTLEQAGWQVRGLMADCDESLHGPLAELAAALFTAGRAATTAESLLARVDRPALERRHEAERQMAISSPSASRRRDALEVQIALVNRVLDRRDAVTALADTVAEGLRDPPPVPHVARLQRQVGEATGALDASVTRATARLDALAFRLQRTRYRGIYRSGKAWVVPFVDTVGAEGRRQFPTCAEAREFVVGVRLAGKAKRAYQGPSYTGGDQAGAGGSGL